MFIYCFIKFNSSNSGTSKWGHCADLRWPNEPCNIVFCCGNTAVLHPLWKMESFKHNFFYLLNIHVLSQRRIICFLILGLSNLPFKTCLSALNERCESGGENKQPVGKPHSYYLKGIFSLSPSPTEIGSVMSHIVNL